MALVAVDGEIDLATAPTLRNQLSEQLDSADCRVLVVDLAAAGFFGVCGVDVLVDMQLRADRDGIELRLVTCRLVQRVLQIVGVEESFTVYPTRESAVSDDPRAG